MTFDEELEKEIAEIIGGLQCPKSFMCYRSGFEKLCKVKDFSVEVFLECLEDTPQTCKFSLMIGRSYMCQCPLRYYIFKKLKK
jgi:hypothetical protein